MGEETTDTGKALELLSIASLALQIHKLAGEGPLPVLEASVFAGDIAEEVLKRARTLLRKAEHDDPPGE